MSVNGVGDFLDVMTELMVNQGESQGQVYQRDSDQCQHTAAVHDGGQIEEEQWNRYTAAATWTGWWW